MNPESTPDPVGNDLPHMADAAVDSVRRRKDWGVQKYGVALQPFNRRDAAVDAHEEALDLLVYMEQLTYERAHLRDVLTFFGNDDGVLRIRWVDNTFHVFVGMHLVLDQPDDDWHRIMPETLTAIRLTLRDVAVALRGTEREGAELLYALCLWHAHRYTLDYSTKYPRVTIPNGLRPMFDAAAGKSVKTT